MKGAWPGANSTTEATATILHALSPAFETTSLEQPEIPTP